MSEKSFNVRAVRIILKDAYVNFKQNDALRIAASTAFFGTFAIPAILVVILQIFGIFLNRRAFSHSIIIKLTQIIGDSSAEEIRRILFNLLRLGENWIFTLGMFLFLIFVSTTLFIIIRNSINQLWAIRVRRNLGFSFMLKQRAKSLAIITIGGFLLSIAFVFEGLRLFLEKKLENSIPLLNGFVNELVFFITTTIWFCIAFKFIANGRPTWRSVLISSGFTGILLTIGKLVMRKLLLNSNIDQIYGTSGAILLVMLFIFYSSFIFYYGACLVNSISKMFHTPIVASSKAHKYKIELVED